MRPTRSQSGQARALQLLSPSAISIYTEGTGIDVCFYENILSHSTILSKMGVTLNSSKMFLNYRGNGKESILQNYRILLTANKLFSKFRNGTHKIILFALDKDIDDIENNLINSDHILYSQHYSIENHIFRATDISKSISCHLLIPSNELKRIRIDNDWISTVHTYWSKWISYCLFVKIHKIPKIKNFSSPTQINHNCFGGICLKKLKKFRTDIIKNSGISANNLNKKITQYHKITLEHLNKGSCDSIFNGKWYFHALLSYLKNIKSPPLRKTDIKEHEIWGYFLNNTDWNHHEIRYFSINLESMVTKILR